MFLALIKSQKTKSRNKVLSKLNKISHIFFNANARSWEPYGICSHAPYAPTSDNGPMTTAPTPPTVLRVSSLNT
jgi:hypothetical protein